LPQRQAHNRRGLIHGLKPKRTARSPEVGEQVVLSRLHTAGVSAFSSTLPAPVPLDCAVDFVFVLVLRDPARNHHVANVSAFRSCYLTSTPFQKAT
jgi:hypothetical protein